MAQWKRDPVTGVLALILATLAGAAALPVSGAEPGELRVQEELEAFIDDVFESEPAWGGALVAQQGRVIFEKSYGWADWSQARPNVRNTVFRIQSMSKTFAAMATLLLVERGQLTLEDRVVDYVPELAEGEGVTIRHLLRMESGIPDYVDDVVTARKEDSFHTPEEVLEYFRHKPLNFVPGTKFEYSNSNYVLLGLIIERVTEQPYGRFLKKNIFRPLGMKHSRFDPRDRAFARIRAVGYDDVTVDPPTVARYYHPAAAYAAGGILSRARDLLKWDQALYTERLLSQEILEEAFTPGVGGYGLGWIIDHVRIQGRRNKLVWHTGGGPGFRSILVRMVDANVTLVVLYNTSGVEKLGAEDVFHLIPRIARKVGEIVLEGSDSG